MTATKVPVNDNPALRKPLPKRNPPEIQQPIRFAKGELKLLVEEAVATGVSKPADIVAWIKKEKGRDTNLSSVYQTTLSLRKSRGEAVGKEGWTKNPTTEPTMSDVLALGQALTGKRRNDVEDAGELLASVAGELSMTVPVLIATLAKMKELRSLLG